MKPFFKIILFLLFLNGYSQSLDSIHYQPIIFFEEIYQQYYKFPTLISESKIENFTASSISYYRDSKDLKLGQEPKKKQNFSIQTNGIYKNHHNVIFFGNITITKQYLDNLKWNLSYMDIEDKGIMPDPNYYAVSKGSDWNNQLYNIEGGVTIPITDKWGATMYINYYLREKFRTEYDPRPNIKQNILNGYVGFNYKINPNQNISIEGLYGYSDVDNDIDYSDNDTNVPFYVNKYVRWVLGYGTLQVSSCIRTKRELKNKGISLGYHFHNNSIKWLNYFRYQTNKTDTYKNNNKDTTIEDIRAIFSKNKYHFNSNFLKQFTKNKILSINISIENQVGSNFLVSESGKNYEYSSWKSSLSSSLSKWNIQKRYSQVGINLLFESHKQQDRLAQTKLNHSFAQAEIQYEKEFSLSEKWYLLPSLQFAYKKVLNIEIQNGNRNYIESLNKLDFSGQALKLFYEEVVYNDYEYLKQDFFKIHYRFNFQRKSEKIRTIISFSQTNYFIKNKMSWSTGLSLTLQY